MIAKTLKLFVTLKASMVLRKENCILFLETQMTNN
ncbi:hypothetical protein NSTC731_05283 [Nostoc sp. DSM 114167]